MDSYGASGYFEVIEDEHTLMILGVCAKSAVLIFARSADLLARHNINAYHLILPLPTAAAKILISLKLSERMTLR
jgi:hypothetical protein